MAIKKTVDTAKYSKFLIYLIVVVLLNIAGITLFFRMDLTSNKVYSLSKASKEVVSTLSEPLTVKVFFNSNLPAPYNNIERYLHDLLEEYSIAGSRYFNYQFYSVSGEDNEDSNKIRQWLQVMASTQCRSRILSRMRSNSRRPTWGWH